MDIPDLIRNYLIFGAIGIGFAIFFCVIYRSVNKNRKEGQPKTGGRWLVLTGIVVLALDAFLLSELNKGSIANSIAADDHRYQQVVGAVMNIGLVGKSRIALTVRDELGKFWRINFPGQEALHEDSRLNIGTKISFPQYYYDFDGFVFTKPNVAWKKYFNEKKIGSPPITILPK